MHPPDSQGLGHQRRWNWLPSACEVCGQWPARDGWGAVCGLCIGSFTPTIRRCCTCAIALADSYTVCTACQSAPPPLDRCIAGLDYAFPWIGLIHRFKFQSEPGWAGLFAKLMLKAPGALDVLRDSDWIMPIPMSPSSLGDRGYNQAWLLAKAVSSELGRNPSNRTDARTRQKFCSQGLLKITDTPPQHQLDRALRHQNLKHAFVVAPAMSSSIVNKHITLIDDIMTTGSTLHAAATALRKAGAAGVSACVLAKTPAPANSEDGAMAASGETGTERIS